MANRPTCRRFGDPNVKLFFYFKDDEHPTEIRFYGEYLAHNSEYFRGILNNPANIIAGEDGYSRYDVPLPPNCSSRNLTDIFAYLNPKMDQPGTLTVANYTSFVNFARTFRMPRLFKRLDKWLYSQDFPTEEQRNDLSVHGAYSKYMSMCSDHFELLPMAAHQCVVEFVSLLRSKKDDRNTEGIRRFIAHSTDSRMRALIKRRMVSHYDPNRVFNPWEAEMINVLINHYELETHFSERDYEYCLRNENLYQGVLNLLKKLGLYECAHDFPINGVSTDTLAKLLVSECRYSRNGQRYDI